MSLPAIFRGEYATLPFNILCGFLAGQLRQIASDKEAIWSFSPFVDLSIYRWLKRNLPRPHIFDWQNVFFLTILVLRFMQSQIDRFLPSTSLASKARTFGRMSRFMRHPSWRLESSSRFSKVSGFRRSWKNKRNCCSMREWKHCRTRSIPTSCLIRSTLCLPGSVRPGYCSRSDHQASDNIAAAAQKAQRRSCLYATKWSSSQLSRR